MRRYQESERCGKLGYEDEFLHYLEKLVRDLDRRIERGRERLQKSVSAKQKVCPRCEWSDATSTLLSYWPMGDSWCPHTVSSLLKVLQGETGINSDKLKNLNDEINMKVAEVWQLLASQSPYYPVVCVCVFFFSIGGQLDTLGTRGLVEEAQQLMKRVEDLERERERERMHLVNMTHKVGVAARWTVKKKLKRLRANSLYFFGHFCILQRRIFSPPSPQKKIPKAFLSHVSTY